MMRFYLAIIFPIFFCLGISLKNKLRTTEWKVQKSLPIINKDKSYPEKTFNMEAEVSYIPLETRKDIILDQGAHIYYVSDKRMLITNSSRGDVFIFDMNGKAVSHFNQKGGKGYIYINYAIYDENNKEVFILDEQSKKIVVFTEEGTFKRTLHLLGNMNITQIHNFDKNSLLAYHEHLYGPIEQRQPYMFLSKKDGSILSRLNINLDKANPTYLISGNNWFRMGNTASGNCMFGQEFILANRSSDTIYILKQDKTLTPLFVQYPTVFSDPPTITGVVMKTDNIIAFSVYPYNLKESKRKLESGDNRPSDGGVRFLIYDLETGQFFKNKKWKYVANKIDIPKDMHIELISAYRLVERLKLGLLQGKLKEVAANLKIDDNPVVEITKFN